MADTIGENGLPKINIPQTAIRAALVSAGAAFVFNKSQNIPIAGDLVAGYQKAVKGILKAVGGNIKDDSMLNAGGTSLIDFIGIGFACVVLGRLGGEQHMQRLGSSIKGLYNNLTNDNGLNR